MLACVSMKSFLLFVPVPTPSVTASVDVCIARTSERIGSIAWHVAWRQYAFTPAPGRAFTRLAMRLIASKLARLTRQWLDRNRAQQPDFVPKRGAPIPKRVKYSRAGRPTSTEGE